MPHVFPALLWTLHGIGAIALHSGGSRIASNGDAEGPGLGVTVRYSMFADSADVLVDQMKLLEGSVCSVERFFRPPLEDKGGDLSYLIYTDKMTHDSVETWRTVHPAKDQIRLINLDTDATDGPRMTALLSRLPPSLDFQGIEVSSRVSIRRYLADMNYLPSSRGKLLLGNDFEFIQNPSELLKHVFPVQFNTAAYMGFYGYEDAAAPKRVFDGPQCPGMVADLIYASPGTPFQLNYALNNLALWLNFQFFDTDVAANREKMGVSPGYCADQWSLTMHLGHWSNGTCARLSNAYKTYSTGPPEPPTGFEGIHDKEVRCEL